MLICSSAGGGLRLAVVGYEAEVTAEAGHRVGLSAGGRVVHVSSGPMTTDDVTALRTARPDLVLLVGGTDGGNADVLLHNADRLARSRVAVPLVVAGNAEVAPAVSALLAGTGRRFVVADNVLPRIGVVAPAAARSAIRDAFLRHVIGGKGLSRGRGFRDLVRAATPDAVLRGVEVLADVVGRDVLVVDVGGATTDVYSVITPQGEDATVHREVVGTLWHARTVEGDLGMRWNAEGVVEAARRERLPLPLAAAEYAGRVAADPGYLAASDAEWRAEQWLAETAAVVAVRRHGRPPHSSERPRPSRRSPSSSARVACCAMRRRVSPSRVLRQRHRRPRRGLARPGERSDVRRHGIRALRGRPARGPAPRGGVGSRGDPGRVRIRWEGEQRLAVGGGVRSRWALPRHRDVRPSAARHPGGSRRGTRRVAPWNGERHRRTTAVIAGARATFARFVHVPASTVAIGSQVSPLVALVAATVPDGGTVLVPQGEFTSVTFPFLAQSGRGVRVVEAPLREIAEHVDGTTALVALAAVQSSDGSVAPARGGGGGLSRGTVSRHSST